ncbi:hypothetical protein [Actinacidiphila glaucinigra]|uniref:hypothetical protein n=1 Tax=Actinacidiphila glaucinigra TaxID=235986 RepID=UPI000B780E29|nr:hypothetical protein [Actinacidiphila glaucinigra]
MTDADPLVPLLAGIVVDVVHFLDTCGDDEVAPDVAVRTAEHAGWVLHNLPPRQRARFLRVLDDLAAAEPDPARRRALESFGFACGLVAEEPS